MAVKGYREISFSLFLEKVGLWFNPDRGALFVFLQKCRTYYCSISSLSQVVCFLITGYNKKTLQDTAFFGLVGTLISVQLHHFQNCQEGVRRIIRIVKDFQAEHKEEWQVEIYQNACMKGWKLVYTYIYIQLVYIFFYLYGPLFVDFIVGNIWPSLPSIRLPVPQQGVVDLTVERSLLNFIISFLGSTWACLSILGHIGVECIIYMTVLFTRVEMKIIIGKLARLKEVLIAEPRRQENRHLLRDAAIHHQQVLGILDDMNEVFGFPIAVQNFCFAMAFCAAMYGVSVVEDAEDLRPALQNLYSLSCCMGIIYFACAQGEKLETENSEILMSLYDLPWYQEDSLFRRQLNIMITQSCRPYVVNYHQRSHLNVNNFMQISNAAYSYFMMLKSTT